MHPFSCARIMSTVSKSGERVPIRTHDAARGHQVFIPQTKKEGGSFAHHIPLPSEAFSYPLRVSEDGPFVKQTPEKVHVLFLDGPEDPLLLQERLLQVNGLV